MIPESTSNSDKDRIILAIESSCDDTAAAVIINGRIASNLVAGQSVHEAYGGVVPELASRAHQQHILPVVDQALQKANVSLEQLSAIGFTKGPGLIGSLMVGSSFAKSLALALNIPLIGVHHMQAHVLAHFIDEPFPTFPFLCLTVSGGHTMLTVMTDYFEGEVIGRTLDDAAGEAFDKCAKILGLPYPGGPLIDQYAQQGDPTQFSFPITTVPDLDFSFSGIKTAFLYFVRHESAKNPDFVAQNLPDLCASIQKNIVSQLMKKVALAAKHKNIQQIALAGGVSANSELRKALLYLGLKNKYSTFIPAFEYCTDNAAMIAKTADLLFQLGRFEELNASPFAR